MAPAVNDENSSALGGGLLASQLKAPAAAGLQQQQPPVKQQQLQGSSLKSARKAFGNITNSGRGDASAAKQQQPRRAFGDITNSAVKAPAGGGGLGGATSKKQGSSSLFSSSQKQPTATKKAPAPPVPPPPAAASSSSAPAQASAAAAAEQASSQAQWWEGLEPERAAGKTWEQQEADREAAMEAEAIRSADEMWDSVLRAGFLQELVSVGAWSGFLSLCGSSSALVGGVRNYEVVLTYHPSPVGQVAAAAGNGVCIVTQQPNQLSAVSKHSRPAHAIGFFVSHHHPACLTHRVLLLAHLSPNSCLFPLCPVMTRRRVWS